MALTKCPECGKEISSRAASCPQCGFPIIPSTVSLTERDHAKTESAEATPSITALGPEQSVVPLKPADTIGTLLVMVPLVAAGLAFFWVGNMRLIDGPWSKLGLLAAGTVLITAGLVTTEAQRLGFGSDTNRPRSERDSPITWLFGMVLIWFISYPRYLYLRSRYGARNLLLAGLVGMVIWFLAFGYVTASIVSTQDQIQQKIQELQR